MSREISLQEVENCLRLRLEQGQSLEEAVQHVYSIDGYGLMYLTKALANVQGITHREAARFVVRATFDVTRREL